MYLLLWVHCALCVQRLKCVPNETPTERNCILESTKKNNSREHQQQVNVHGARSTNYRSIDWSKPHIDELYGMYVQEPLSMQCNQSNGYRFPGYDWEGTPITQATVQVPLRRFEACENFNPYGVIPLEQGDCGYLGECIY